MEKKIIRSDQAPQAIGHYSVAVASGCFLFVSGQLGLDPVTGTLQAGIDAQTRQSLANLKAILEAAGTDLDAVVKTTVFLSDIANFATVNTIYAEFFTQSYPAGLLFKWQRCPKAGWLRSKP